MKNVARIALALFVLWTLSAACQELQIAAIGDLKLESGEVLRDCRLGYRTFGKVNDDKSNVILVPTWANGTTQQWSANVGPGKLADSSKYYIVLVDALSNGVSSSPSNSTLQPRMKFPKITIRDMVNSQHELLTKILKIQHVKAVMGISMGGMQTFQWMVSYPEFMDKAIPISGSPQSRAYDLLVWQAQIDAITHNSEWSDGEYTSNPARLSDYEFGALLLKEPESYNRTVSREQFFQQIEAAKTSTTAPDANNKIRQAQAMMALDVAAPFGGSLERAAAVVKAKPFIIVSKTDHVVTPESATDFARLLHAEFLELGGECGHQASSCDEQRVVKQVNDFLAK